MSWEIIRAGRSEGHGFDAMVKRREREKELKRRNLAVGLTEDGYASWAAPKPGGGVYGSGVYDPRDPGDVARVRRLMAGYGYPDWEPFDVEAALEILRKLDAAVSEREARRKG